ncbi:hypothetical protein LIA77_02912 [Sarocladium implicatum]|nr:hypothetical protein LIA77_02912 [Sarocladium implicatum]
MRVEEVASERSGPISSSVSIRTSVEMGSQCDDLNARSMRDHVSVSSLDLIRFSSTPTRSSKARAADESDALDLDIKEEKLEKRGPFNTSWVFEVNSGGDGHLTLLRR